jgi:hypothetical protein
VPITYVSQQLGHKDPYFTLKYYANWLLMAVAERLVDVLDGANPGATPAQPAGGAGADRQSDNSSGGNRPTLASPPDGAAWLKTARVNPPEQCEGW